MTLVSMHVRGLFPLRSVGDHLLQCKGQTERVCIGRFSHGEVSPVPCACCTLTCCLFVCSIRASAGAVSSCICAVVLRSGFFPRMIGVAVTPLPVLPAFALKASRDRALNAVSSALTFAYTRSSPAKDRSRPSTPSPPKPTSPVASHAASPSSVCAAAQVPDEERVKEKERNVRRGLGLLAGDKVAFVLSRHLDRYVDYVVSWLHLAKLSRLCVRLFRRRMQAFCHWKYLVQQAKYCER